MSSPTFGANTPARHGTEGKIQIGLEELGVQFQQPLERLVPPAALPAKILLQRLPPGVQRGNRTVAQALYPAAPSSNRGTPTSSRVDADGAGQLPAPSPSIPLAAYLPQLFPHINGINDLRDSTETPLDARRKL